MLSIQNLSIRLKQKGISIVEGFALEAMPGQSIALVGESGAGKSSVLYSILGLLPKNFDVTGSVSFNGDNLLALPEKKLSTLRGRQIGFVSQNCPQSFDPLFRVGTQLEELLKAYYPKKKRKERQSLAIEMLSEMDLNPTGGILRMFPAELSGGMIQRLAILFAVAASPFLLLADELTSALDKRVEEEIMQLLLSKVRKDKMGFLWVTHDLILAEKFADEVLVLKDGKVVEKIPARDLLNSPRSSYARYLVDSIPKGQRHAE